VKFTSKSSKRSRPPWFPARLVQYVERITNMVIMSVRQQHMRATYRCLIAADCRCWIARQEWINEQDRHASLKPKG
jgi:hypothetical protein